MTIRFGILGIFAGGVLASAGAAQEATYTQAQIDGAGICPSVYGLEVGETKLCLCNERAMQGSAWGTGAYTGDSNVCVAALHAGALSAEGGVVEVTGLAGQESYSGSTQNGITTRDWTSYGFSFQVAAAQVAPEQVASEQVAETPEQCTIMPSNTDRHSCLCPPSSGEGGGLVWGFGPYSVDSDICKAARHAGYIDTEGGAVTVLKIQGLEAYQGGESNGVVSSNWGPHPYSIVFDWNTP